MPPYSLLPQYCNPYRQQGALLIPILLLLAPLLSLWIGVSAMARHQMLDTRIHQTQIQGVLGLAQAQKYLDAPQRNAMSNGYAKINIAALGSEQFPAMENIPIMQGRVAKISSRYAWAAWFEEASNPLANALQGFSVSTTKVAAERFHKRTEVAFALSASFLQTTADILRVRQGVQLYIDEMFDHEEHGDNVWISLISFGDRVNIGWKYKDELITPSSRSIPPELHDTARKYNWLESNDLLHPNGVEGWRQGACVARIPVINAANTARYLNLIEHPPLTPLGGFDLVVGRPPPPSVHNPYLLSFFIGNFASSNAAWSIFANSYRRANLPLPPTYRYQQPPVVYGVTSSKNIPPQVSVDGECGNMPILIAAQSRSILKTRLEQHIPLGNTGMDEGLLWAFRALSPNWQSIWKNNGAPHSYASNVDKKLIVITAYKNDAGYVSSSTINAIPLICKMIKDRGIELSVIGFGQFGASYFQAAQKEMRACTSDPVRNFIVHASSQEVPEALSKLSARPFRVRLIAPT